MSGKHPLRRCLFVINHPSASKAKLGGGGISMLTLWNDLPTYGWTAIPVSPSYGPMAEVLHKKELQHINFNYKQPEIKHPIQTFHTFIRWCKIIHKTKPDIIHTNTPDTARSILMAARFLSVPLVSHVRMPIPETAAGWVFRYMPRPTGLIFNSHYLKNETWPLIEQSCPHCTPYVVHNGVDLDQFTYHPPPPAPPYRVGIIGHLTPAKAHNIFIKMAHHVIKQSVLDIEFWVIGDDVFKTGRMDELRSLAYELGIQDRVKFLGHQSNVPAIMKNLHLTVLTSQLETFGRVIIESFASGRPVVATTAGGIPEVVKDGKTGFLVQPGDYKSMANYVIRLLTDQALWNTFSQAGQSDVVNRFSGKQHARNMVDVYDEILARQSA